MIADASAEANSTAAKMTATVAAIVTVANVFVAWQSGQLLVGTGVVSLENGCYGILNSNDMNNAWLMVNANEMVEGSLMVVDVL